MFDGYLPQTDLVISGPTLGGGGANSVVDDILTIRRPNLTLLSTLRSFILLMDEILHHLLKEVDFKD